MRIGLIAAASACVMLGACGGPETSQANNAQANIANDAVPDATANASATNAMPMLATTPVSKEQAAQIMHERHEGMEATGKAAKAAAREFQGSSPDLAVIRASAKAINDFAPKVPRLVPLGTGPEAGKTGAKPEIWQNLPDFNAKAKDFQFKAQAFAAAASGSDVGAMKARFGDLMQSCKACHDKYRSEMHH